MYYPRTSERDAPTSGEREIAVTSAVDIGATRRAPPHVLPEKVALPSMATRIVNGASLLRRGKQFS
jgi:hypothetical protein